LDFPSFILPRCASTPAAPPSCGLGDIAGAVTGDAGLPATAIRKIDVFATRS